jgi:ribosome-associated protein
VAEESLFIHGGREASPYNRINSEPRHETHLMRPRFTILPDEVEFSAIRAQGAGGQNVNKVSSAVHLRFDIAASSLPEDVRERLLRLGDQRISKDGVVIIKAQVYRSLEKNRAEALRRLEELITGVAETRIPRRPTKPTRASVARRMEDKAKRAAVKAQRGKARE